MWRGADRGARGPQARDRNAARRGAERAGPWRERERGGRHHPGRARRERAKRVRRTAARSRFSRAFGILCAPGSFSSDWAVCEKIPPPAHRESRNFKTVSTLCEGAYEHNSLMRIQSKIPFTRSQPTRSAARRSRWARGRQHRLGRQLRSAVAPSPSPGCAARWFSSRWRASPARAPVGGAGGASLWTPPPRGACSASRAWRARRRCARRFIARPSRRIPTNRAAPTRGSCS